MKYLITGGTGFVGKRLIKEILASNAAVIVLTRDKKNCNQIFENKVRAISSLSEIDLTEKIDCIINLAGEPIADKKWSSEQKQKLISSRLNTTGSLVELIANLKNKPECLISASAIGYYGAQADNIVTEDSAPNNEFTHELCKSWEASAIKAKDSGVRVCIIRLGVVLGKNGGALKKMLPAFKLGLGGKIGDGKQYFSWVHIEDVVSAINFLVKNKDSKGIYNLTSPNPITNAEFTKVLGAAVRRPTFFNMPAFMVKLIFGEMGDRLLLNGQRVIPKKLLDEGFNFKHPTITAMDIRGLKSGGGF
jgi:uncharacterized protein (TIGR01777 family)